MSDNYQKIIEDSLKAITNWKINHGLKQDTIENVGFFNPLKGTTAHTQFIQNYNEYNSYIPGDTYIKRKLTGSEGVAFLADGVLTTIGQLIQLGNKILNITKDIALWIFNEPYLWIPIIGYITLEFTLKQITGTTITKTFIVPFGKKILEKSLTIFFGAIEMFLNWGKKFFTSLDLESESDNDDYYEDQFESLTRDGIEYFKSLFGYIPKPNDYWNIHNEIKKIQNEVKEKAKNIKKETKIKKKKFKKK